MKIISTWLRASLPRFHLNGSSESCCLISTCFSSFLFLLNFFPRNQFVEFANCTICFCFFSHKQNYIYINIPGLVEKVKG